MFWFDPGEDSDESDVDGFTDSNKEWLTPTSGKKTQTKGWEEDSDSDLVSVTRGLTVSTG